MFTISKRFGPFCAAHHLPHLPAGHPCARPHGHNYYVTVELHGDRLNDDGFLLDFTHLAFAGDFCKQVMDHRDLNETFPYLKGRTTSELLARDIGEFVADTLLLNHPDLPTRVRRVRVGVSETEKSIAWCERELLP